MMKNIIKKIMSLAVVVAVLAVAPMASASYSINSLSNDCQTVTIANHTTGAGAAVPCWTNTSISANVGEVINVAIYYNNSGSSNANNVSFKLTDPQNQNIPSNGTVSMTGSILVNGQVVKTGIVNLNVSGGPSRLVLGNVMKYEQSSNANLPVSGGNAILSSGYSIGTLAPGWTNQGVIKVSFTVVADNTTNPDPTPTGIAPNVATNQYSNYNSTYGNVTINGTFDSNGYSTTTSFKYRMNGGSWTTVGTTNRGTGSGPFNFALSDLPSGNYEYRAVASNAHGTVEGSIFTFSISRDNTTSCPSGYYLSGNTCIQNPISCPSGYYLSGNTCIQNPVSCPSGYYQSGNTCIQNPVQNCNSNQYWNGSYCVTITQNCGYNQYWNGSTCVTNQPTTSLPSVSTLGTISVGATAVAVDGYYTANGCDVYTSFKYGTTQALGITTGEVNRSNGSGSMAQSLSGLSANTTYYYQAIARNCVGTTVGSIRSFTTSNDTTRDTVIIRTITNNTTTGGGGSAFLKLMITNNREIVRSDRDVTYEVSWENISGRDLDGLVLEVNFPEQVGVLDTDRGSIKREAHSVIYKIGDLKKAETGSMDITTEVVGSLRNGDPVVAQAIMAFENPTTRAAENAIAYDADEFMSADGSVLGASLFGLDFFPTSLAGWLLIILILLIIVLLAHAYFARSRANVVVNQAAGGAVPNNIPTDNGNDYIVYRPTKQ